ncbi:hypothetical protein DEIPH_ctg139orf0053 [Deinococcus phoenicis]|uniref:Uncharacterized protein n=1 Tax=Deinococcus phoenicis TaxID=1476583 RepID=A0A016QJI5_9DEIO|nr:hypothetical protein DEIPH_ctg139orf0053 [Deinococcus phoenicis]
MRAFTCGERDAETLYAYRRAGAQVHPLLDAAASTSPSAESAPSQ